MVWAAWVVATRSLLPSPLGPIAAVLAALRPAVLLRLVARLPRAVPHPPVARLPLVVVRWAVVLPLLAAARAEPLPLAATN